MFEIDTAGDPFVALPPHVKARRVEDAYLFGVRLRIVATRTGISDAASLASHLGLARPTEPTLEDVFVSLARRQVTASEKVQS
jgi:hypothetical protein